MIVKNPKDIFNKITKDDFKELLDVSNKYKELNVDILYDDYCNSNKKLLEVYKL